MKPKPKVTARVGVAFQLVYRNKAGEVIKTVDAKGSIPLKEKRDGVDVHR